MELMNTSKQDITLAWGRFYYTFKSEESKEVSQVIYNAALRRYDDDLIDSIEYKKQEAKLKKEEADQKTKLQPSRAGAGPEPEHEEEQRQRFGEVIHGWARFPQRNPVSRHASQRQEQPIVDHFLPVL